MIVKFAKPGASFKGVALYLTHDPDHAATSERVAWTHTLNLAHDHIESAVHEMYTTCLDAELLKAEAGVRAANATVEKPVKHISLNWHPSETPEREDMIRAAESFLKRMGWHEHQAALIAHDDKAYRHVHLVVNAIHPVTGLKLNDSFEKRRAQEWALGYEREMGRIFCEQRLKPLAERQASEPRPAWMAMREQVERELFAERSRNEFDLSYMGRAENRGTIERQEWEILKELQKEERLAFFTEGKQVYKDLNRALYREVREEFRPDWASYYAAKRDGLGFQALAEIRAGLIARQKEVLDERREAAAGAVRAVRDKEYRALLDAQKEQRADLIDRQELGLSSPHLLDRAYPVQSGVQAERGGTREVDALERFGIRRGRDVERTEARTRGARRDVGKKLAPAAPSRPRSFSSDAGKFQGGLSRGGLVTGVSSNLAGGLLGLFGALGESITGKPGKSQPREPAPEIDPLDRFGVRRGRPPPDAGEEKGKREAVDRDTWAAWKRKREILMDK